MVQKATHFRWIIVTLIFILTIINYIDRASVGFALPAMEKEFSLTASQMGYVLGSFGIGYIFSTIIGGLLVDKFRAHVLITITVFIWSFAMGWIGFASGFLTLFLARFLLGLAEGPNFPATNRAVSDWLPIHETSRALAGCLLAVPCALMLGGPLVTYLIATYSWRIMFFTLCVLSFLWLPFWWGLFRNFPQQSKFVNKQELKIIKQDIQAKHERKRSASLFSNKTLLANYLAFFVFGYYLFFFMGWLPEYLHQQFNLNLKEIGLFNILPWLLGMAFLFVGGVLGDKIYNLTQNARYARTYIILISQLLASLMIIPIVLTNSLYMALIFISLAVAFILSANSAYFATVIDVNKARAGAALGIADASFALSGVVSPIVTGWLINFTHQYTISFLLMTFLAFLSVVIVYFWHHPERDYVNDK